MRGDRRYDDTRQANPMKRPITKNQSGLLKLALMAVICMALAAGAQQERATGQQHSAQPQKPLKVFILAGDECMLRQGSIDGIPREAAKKTPATAKPAEMPGTLLNVINSNPRYAWVSMARP